ncbi:MAG: NPCBM/NEW2 domain-containing protein [Planctomycetaceae bacterium]|jgi:hypothetical protein|nr:NPCBM/NEW2 domain-containing protein [Planctomycetaceae bacterium]
MKNIFTTHIFATLIFAILGFNTIIAEEFKTVETKLIIPATKAQTLRVDLNGADDLYLVAGYGGDSYDSDQAIWAEPILYDQNNKPLRLTELKPVAVKTGWGNLLVDKNHQGKLLSIAGESFKFGFWAHAPSIIQFKLDGKYKRFETKVGLDSGSGRGTVTFQIRNTPVSFPSTEEYTKNFPKAPSAPPAPRVPPVSEAALQFHSDTAQKLLDRGIEEILFIRRFTYTGNHIYTEYVNSRWMPGGGLCALNLKTGKVREIVPELTRNGVVGWFDLSFDAKKIVFDFKKGPDDGYRIYEAGIDGSGLRQLTLPESNEAELVKKYRRGYHHGTDDMEPCYLPDGGIVFATTRCQFGVLCDSGDAFTVKNLYRMNADGSCLRPLSRSALSEATPTILSDGRILYHRWEYVDKSAGNAKALWSMNPDGSGSAEVYGNSISFPETMIQARAIPDEPNKIVMLGASHCCPNNAVGTVILVDTAKNIRSIDAMRYITGDVAAFHHNGFHFKDEKGNWIHESTGKPGRLFRNPYPISVELFLVSHKPKGLIWSEPAGYDLALLDESGRETILLKDSTVSLWHPYPVVPRSKPVQQLSGMSVDAELAEQGLARCIVTDIYVGMEKVKRGEVKYIRILEQLPRPWSARKNYGDDHAGTTHAHSALGNGMLSAKVQHGVVPVEEDGSAHFLVPAGKAIYFQALDKNFCAIQTERTFVNYNPGETRSCVGCHETPDMTPPQTAAIPKGILREASIPVAQLGQAEAKIVFDYDRQIQPILDKHCVTCHGGAEEIKAGLDLRGEPQATFSVSYNSLIRLSKSEHQLLGNRKYRDEDAAMNGIEYIPPYQTGALSSPLAALIYNRKQTTRDNPVINRYTNDLVTAHAKAVDLKLSETEKLTITNWLDINCQFHPSYWGRLHSKFRNDPNYRPALTFDEVRSETVPEKLHNKKNIVKK